MLIRDLDNMDMVDPKWVDTFEEYIPKWLESLKPHYELRKERGVDVVELINRMYLGDKPEEIERNGVFYYLDDFPLWGKTLSFNANLGSYPASWETGFNKIYTEPVDKYGIRKYSNFLWSHTYLWRFLNRKPPYNELPKRIERLFQQIVNDDSVLFDFESVSYIIFNPAKKCYIDNKLEA